MTVVVATAAVKLKEMEMAMGEDKMVVDCKLMMVVEASSRVLATEVAVAVKEVVVVAMAVAVVVAMVERMHSSSLHQREFRQLLQ